LIIDAPTRDALLSEKDTGTIFCHHQEYVKVPFPTPASTWPVITGTAIRRRRQLPCPTV